ncbi:hypothetical protein B0H13DRAFT_1627703 [Mycena leptocephala]|nr:hypothetical protein B0H13DRAFT_1627703 [Mycena leptocephala]
MSNFLPPLDCSLNFGEIIDLHIARENRSAAYSFADGDGHMTDISHFEFARAAHRVAHLLRPQRRGPEGQIVAIAALTDVLIYQTIVAGCIRAGLIPFQISHRNSAAAIFHLLGNTGFHRLLTTTGSLAHLVDAVSAELSTTDHPYELSVEEIPLLGQLYPHLGHETTEDAFVPYPDPTTRTSLDDIAMYLHSSGATGFPKCIPETHRSLIHYAALGQHFSLMRRFRLFTFRRGSLAIGRTISTPSSRGSACLPYDGHDDTTPGSNSLRRDRLYLPSRLYRHRIYHSR